MKNDTMLDIIEEVRKAVENNTLTEAHIKRLQRVISQINKDIDLLTSIASEQPTERRKALIARYTSKYIALWDRLTDASESLTDGNKKDSRQAIIRLNDAYKMIEERL